MSIENHHYGSGSNFDFQWVLRVRGVNEKNWNLAQQRNCSFRRDVRVYKELEKIFALMKRRLTTHKMTVPSTRNVISALSNKQSGRKPSKKLQSYESTKSENNHTVFNPAQFQ